MTLLDFLRATQVDQPLPRPVFELLEGPEPIDAVETLGPHRLTLKAATEEQLLALFYARHRWILIHEHLEGLETDREASGRPALPSALSATCTWPDELDALARAVDLDSTLAEPLLALWREAVGLARAESTITAEAVVEGVDLDGLSGSVAAIAPERWLAARRLERDGKVKLRWTHSVAGLAGLVAARPALGALTQARSGAALADDFVVRHLDSALSARLALESEEAVITGETGRYFELITAPPTTFHPTAAVYVGTDKQRVGLALIDKRGVVVQTAPVRPTGDWTDRICRWVKENRARMVVVATTSPSEAWLTALVDALEVNRCRILRVSPAGLVQARSSDDPVLRRVGPEEASAIVLARRATQPGEEWCRLDPAVLGLVPSECNPARVREVLGMIRERAIAQTPGMAAAAISAAKSRPSGALNPAIRGIRDLRPGLQLNGVVTNVTKFGAFVNLGLRQEGLIHISEMSDTFVNDPAELCQPGQQVTARVVSIDLERGRIALSMRSENAPPRSGMGSSSGPPRSRPNPLNSIAARPSGPSSTVGGGGDGDRKQAMRDLENLFKK